MATLGQVLCLTLETKMMRSEERFTERQQHKEAKRAGEEGSCFRNWGWFVWQDIGPGEEAAADEA